MSEIAAIGAFLDLLAADIEAGRPTGPRIAKLAD